MRLSPPLSKRARRSRSWSRVVSGGGPGTDLLVAEGIVHLRRVVVGLRLADLADLGGILIVLVEVEGQRLLVVEELRVHRPAAVALGNRAR